MSETHEGLLTGHNFSNGEHYYAVTVPRRGQTDKPVFHLGEEEEAMQAILQYNAYSDLTELLNDRPSDTEILVKEVDGRYEIAVEEMKQKA
jgi:heat shock protein HspQ